MKDLELSFVDARTLMIRPSGRLDRELGQALLRAVSTAVSVRVPRLLVDFSAIRSFTEDAVVAVTGCRRLADRLPGRLEIVPGRGAGALAVRRSCAVAPGPCRTAQGVQAWSR